MKKCPYCAELIQDEAIYCRFCQHDLTNIPTVKTKKCPYCAEEIPETNTRCSVCGHDLGTQRSEPVLATTINSAPIGDLSSEKTEDQNAPEEVSSGENITEKPVEQNITSENINTPDEKPKIVRGSINGNTITFDPEIEIEEEVYGSFEFDSKYGVIDKRDREKATRYAIEQLFRMYGFSRVRLDGVKALKNEQGLPEYENYLYWRYAIPEKRFYPTEDDLITNNETVIFEEGVSIKTRPYKVIYENSDINTKELAYQIMDERAKRISELPKYGVSPFSAMLGENNKKPASAQKQVVENNQKKEEKNYTKSITKSTENKSTVYPGNTNKIYKNGIIFTSAENIMAIIVGILALVSGIAGLITGFSSFSDKFILAFIGIVLLIDSPALFMKKKLAFQLVDVLCIFDIIAAFIIIILSGGLMLPFFIGSVVVIIAIMVMSHKVQNAFKPEVQAKRNNGSVSVGQLRMEQKKSNKKLILIVLAIIVLGIIGLIVVPTIIGYSMKYTVIPEGAYYEAHEYRKGVVTFVYLSDPYWSEYDQVYIKLFSDGTGVFATTIGSEQGCFEMTGKGIECKYNSGKAATFDSLEASDDKTVIYFQILEDGQLIKHKCYLDAVYDQDGNIVEGDSYIAIHGHLY